VIAASLRIERSFLLVLHSLFGQLAAPAAEYEKLLIDQVLFGWHGKVLLGPPSKKTGERRWRFKMRKGILPAR
jgi:hypothetical protein